MRNMTNISRNPHIQITGRLNIQSVGIKCPANNIPVEPVIMAMNSSGFVVGPDRPCIGIKLSKA